MTAKGAHQGASREWSPTSPNTLIAAEACFRMSPDATTVRDMPRKNNKEEPQWNGRCVIADDLRWVPLGLRGDRGPHGRSGRIGSLRRTGRGGELHRRRD